MYFWVGVIWLALCFAVGSYAKGKGKSYGVYFLFSLIFSPLLGFIFAALAKPDESVDKNKIYIEIAENSILLESKYVEDRNKKGDWIIEKKDGKRYVTVSTTRAFEFLIQELANDNSNVLRERLIKARQGKALM